MILTVVEYKTPVSDSRTIWEQLRAVGDGEVGAAACANSLIDGAAAATGARSIAGAVSLFHQD